MRGTWPTMTAGWRSADPTCVPLLPRSHEHAKSHRAGCSEQKITGAPPGTRTPNPRIKSLLLRISIHLLYQHLYARTLARYPQPAEAQWRPLTLYTAWYRDIRANMEQTRKRHGLDHCGRIITHDRETGLGLHRPAAREPLERWIRSVTPAASGPQLDVARIDRSSTHGSPRVSPEALRDSEHGRGTRTSAG